MLTQFVCNDKVVLRKYDSFPLHSGDLMIVQDKKTPYDETAYMIQDILFVFTEGETKQPHIRVYLRETIHPKERN